MEIDFKESEKEFIKKFFNEFNSIKEFLENNSFEDFIKMCNNILNTLRNPKIIKNIDDINNLNVGEIIILQNNFDNLNKQQATE